MKKVRQVEPVREILGGINSVTEALRGPRKIYKLYIGKDSRNPRIEEIVNLAQNKGIAVKLTDRGELDRLYSQAPHQGVVMEAEPYRYADLQDVLEQVAAAGDQALLLVLDGVEDPQNLGAIIRTAECAGVNGIILPRHHSAAITPAVVRASAGATEHMAVVRETNLVNTLKELKKAGMWVVGADMEGSAEYFRTKMPCPAVLVIGGEGRGIRRLVRENCDLLVRIPMYGQVNSLNASVAAALLIYELVRQRSAANPAVSPGAYLDETLTNSYN
ncbi:MAG TPA: 23S rRNA (guanosine(2251)-2'-O)-methyltransferase RlmB [Syntrophomonadaceae bacterium]|nr:23S rRNA (guanosine(2251)-2'-O)-methyltransferase RlmB [Syntrophomonadaceae bacterium]HOQ08607.1 23S rRNA (guanosine(2251)-2'-O)-methyltransferase RlmB [Syntrophomonadaceae bacterium]HPU48837.1 23S rRNA (guanosine(2251)-2'-O)-methyltransferase RlmB [Syntrophomonadaceae bacterium]